MAKFMKSFMYSSPRVSKYYSSTEAEYRTMTEGTKEAVSLIRLFIELKILDATKSIVLRVDNQSNMQIAKNPIFHACRKHIETQYHYIREKIVSQEIDLEHVPTQEQLADIFTNSLGVTTLFILFSVVHMK